jgi:hypothetical protein
MIYLASPYSAAEPAVRQQRFELACRAAAELIRRGKTVFSPIAHSHAICQLGLPKEWAFWEKHDLTFLNLCDEVVVLQLDGWQESIGVQAEIEAARRWGKPVTYLGVQGIASRRDVSQTGKVG